MATKTIKLEQLAETMAKGLQGVIAATTPFFKALYTMIDRDTMMTFKFNGARGEQPAWPKLSPRTLHPSYKGKIYLAKWNLRRGTDNSKRRRYSENSNNQILQASRGFMRSFRILEFTKDKIRYGTNHQLAKQIMRPAGSRFHRPVLFVNNSDLKKWRDLYITFLAKGIKF